MLCMEVISILLLLHLLNISAAPRRTPINLIEEHAATFASIQGACTANTKWPPKDPKSSKTDQVPMQAMCSYCMNAVHSVGLEGGEGAGCTDATDNGMEACEKLVKEVKGKAKAIEKFYKDRLEEFGPGGGWSLEFCLTMKCCQAA